ncbi:pyruvate kinase [Gardnerella vaginalis ATCC 14018 = JCM 11026]|nr:pyruvate kinase [Gardnerella vaginalis]TCH82862.1 pyruvate kinase [Gardnerella vaginalis ATCC 14018 = JCM 11026]
MQVDSQSSDGDSLKQQEKSRISVIKRYAIVQTRKRLGDSWSNSIRAAADTK